MSSNGSNGGAYHLSVWAGRTGTRATSGRPQQRWEDGVALSKEVLEARGQPSTSSLNIATVLSRVLLTARAAVANVSVLNA